jgi:hypothetical protein
MRNVRNPEIVGLYRGSDCDAGRIIIKTRPIAAVQSDRLADAATVPRVEQAMHARYRDTVAITITISLVHYCSSLS